MPSKYGKCVRPRVGGQVKRPPPKSLIQREQDPSWTPPTVRRGSSPPAARGVATSSTNTSTNNKTSSTNTSTNKTPGKGRETCKVNVEEKSGYTKKVYFSKHREEGGKEGEKKIRTTFRNPSTGDVEELPLFSQSTPSSKSHVVSLLRPGEGPSKLTWQQQASRLKRFTGGVVGGFGLDEAWKKINPTSYIPMVSQELETMMPRPFPISGVSLSGQEEVNTVEEAEKEETEEKDPQRAPTTDFQKPETILAEEEKEKTEEEEEVFIMSDWTVEPPTPDQSEPDLALQPAELSLVPVTPVEEATDSPTLQPTEEVVSQSTTSSGDYSPPTEMKYLDPEIKTSWTRVTDQIELEKQGKGFAALDIRKRGTPDYIRSNGDSLVKNLQQKARTINHVVRKVVLNHNLRQIMENVTYLNWDIITREVQEWAAWRMAREEKQMVMDENMLFGMAGEMLRGVEETEEMEKVEKELVARETEWRVREERKAALRDFTFNTILEEVETQVVETVTETDTRHTETDEEKRLRRNTYRVAVLIRKTAVKALDKVGENDTGPVYELKVDRLMDENLNFVRNLFIQVDLGLLDQIITASKFSVWVQGEEGDKTNTRQLNQTPEQELVDHCDALTKWIRTRLGGWNVWQDKAQAGRRVDWRENKRRFKKGTTRVARCQETSSGARCQTKNYRVWY